MQKSIMASKKVPLSVASAKNVKEKQQSVRDAERESPALIGMAKFRRQLDEAEVDLKKAKSKVAKCEEQNVQLRQANKQLSQQKEVLQEKNRKLREKTRPYETEIAKLKEEIQNLKSHLKEATEEVRTWEKECYRASKDTEKLEIMTKKHRSLTENHMKLTQEHGQCSPQMEKLRKICLENSKNEKYLQAANDTLKNRIRNLREDVNEKETHIKLVEKERDEFKREMQSLRYKMQNMEHEMREFQQMKELIQTKEKDNLKLKMTKDQEIMDLHAELRKTVKTKKADTLKLKSMDAKLFRGDFDLYKANQEISKLEDEKTGLECNVNNLLTKVDSLTLELENRSKEISSLEEQLEKREEQEEDMKREILSLKDDLKEIDLLNINISNLENDKDQLTQTNGLQENEIHLLRKLIDDKDNALSQMKTEAQEHQKQAIFYKSEMNKSEQQHYIEMKSLARQRLDTKPKHTNLRIEKVEGQDLWNIVSTNTMTQNKKISKKQNCGDEIKKLSEENKDLKSRLARRPDEPYEEIFRCKKAMQALEDKVKILKVDSMMYFNSWQREKEEKDALQQETRKLRLMVKKPSQPASAVCGLSRPTLVTSGAYSGLSRPARPTSVAMVVSCCSST